jgi:hypothetical protein
MSNLLEKLTEFFTTSEASGLEQFINSKNPSNSAEVEYWTRQYEQNSESFYWSRGL